MITTQIAHTVRREASRLVVDLMHRTLRFSRWVRNRSTSPTHVDDARRRHPAGGSIAISTVDDPDGTMHLIGVRGTVTERNAHRLFGAAHRFGSGLGLGLHIDLTQATIPTIDGLRHLETIIDELERRGFRLRVVGVDPAHPALVASR